MPWSWCQDDKVILVLHWTLGKNVSLPFLTYSLRETGPRLTSSGPTGGQYSQCGGHFKLYSQSFHRTQTMSGPGQETSWLMAPNLYPQMIKALFLGPACTWPTYLSERVLTKEALGLPQISQMSLTFRDHLAWVYRILELIALVTWTTCLNCLL